MDFSNLTKEQVEWIKKLVKESWEDGYSDGYQCRDGFSCFVDTDICTRLEVLGD